MQLNEEALMNIDQIVFFFQLRISNHYNTRLCHRVQRMDINAHRSRIVYFFRKKCLHPSIAALICFSVFNFVFQHLSIQPGHVPISEKKHDGQLFKTLSFCSSLEETMTASL